MSNADTVLLARGEARFVGDIVPPLDTLHVALVVSEQAHARLAWLDVSAALACPGVVAVFTAADIPGQNQIGNIIPDEVLLAEGEVHYVGQAIALIVAESAAAARAARNSVAVAYEPLPAVFDARAAYAQGELIQPPRTFALGEVDAAWQYCATVVQGRADSGAQEHAYLETQVALAVPREQGGIKLWSATQSPSGVQRAAAGVLGWPMHAVQVEVPRLGGGFGGKEEQGALWACLAALAAAKLGRAVRLELEREEDMRWTGKRHPYSADFKLGLDADGRFLAYEVRFFQNAGATADLSTAILERTLFHATHSYYIPNVRATAASCRTHLPPNTAFRGFGAPQAAFVMECAIDLAARRLGVDAAMLQARNLLQDGDVFPYGMAVEQCRARRCWDEAVQRYDVAGLREQVRRFNAAQRWLKQGLALMPVCFGISFTNTALNQAQALVHVYGDGSVGVSCSAVEMGQGVRQKMRALAARTLGIPETQVRVENTDTTRTANMPPTAASTGADLNGQAVRLACLHILERLPDWSPAAGPEGEQRLAHWQACVSDAWARRVNLSAQAHYATPGIGFDRTREQGRPFAYHVYGMAVVLAEVDGLRGTYRFARVGIVHDGGVSLAPLIDLGQVEGGVVQGLGWMALEEIRYDAHGRLLTDNLGRYKIPDIHFAPPIDVHFLDPADNPPGLLHSKAVGEPPFLYGIGGYFALLDALRAFRPEADWPYEAPWTTEKVFMALHGERP